MSEYIDREMAIAYAPLPKYLREYQTMNLDDAWDDGYDFAIGQIKAIPAADVRPVPEGGIGEMSDGYHTFNGLYYQRMVLFAALVKAHKDKAWKSWKHEDGKPCFDGGWFIVGIDTPQGSYTYHYEDKYWNWFECEELPVAKHWDGHTEEDVTRLLSLDVRPVVHGKWIKPTRVPDSMLSECSVCGFDTGAYTFNFCPNCGANMRKPPKEET